MLRVNVPAMARNISQITYPELDIPYLHVADLWHVLGNIPLYT